ncbi:hypothetical protein BL1471 [Bifidobacterium longum NCC2705]|uniref:Uncharacterized protein n=1 Tax=Bifidobacterium longum (strain NCC 2705) TaxID=206672 RepID=Q8G4B7_BIFLO|nr:hypothetical protein BL1471 [Bifidobacterium longum NCC2705]
MVYQLPALPDGVGRRCLVLDGRVHLPVRVVRDLVDVAADAAQLVFDIPERLDGGRIMFLLLDVQASLQQLHRLDDGEGDGLAASQRGILEHPFLVVIDADQHRLFAWTVLPAPSFPCHRFLLSWIIDYQAFGTRVVAPAPQGAGGCGLGLYIQSV